MSNAGGHATQGSPGYVKTGPVAGLLIAALSVSLFWLVWLYANSLRNPRFLDGWVLAALIAAQLGFHIAIKTAILSPKLAPSWRKLHIFAGYLLIPAFLSHTNATLPATTYAWALWGCFVLITLSGIFGTYLAWALKAKRSLEDAIAADRIPARRAELANELQAALARTDPQSEALGLPVPPHDAWIKDLYTTHLRDYVKGPRNRTAHLLGSRRPLRRLTHEIDTLSRFVGKPEQDKLDAIKTLVVEKDRLDFAHVHAGLTKSWLLVHVPLTYALIVLAVLHVLAAYAFSSGGR
jgi:hypothetical protein